MWNHNNPTKENDLCVKRKHGVFWNYYASVVWTRRGLSAGSRCGVLAWTAVVWHAEVSAQIGASARRTQPRAGVTYRNGYRNRTWDTRVGTMALHIPKLREGSYFPSLLEPRRRSEKALLAVIQQAVRGGRCTTRRVDDLDQGSWVATASFQQPGLRASVEQLDEVVESFLGRPLDCAAPSPYDSGL